MPLQATSGAASYDAFGGGVPAVPNYIEDVFSTYLYTGTGSALTITNGIDLSTKGGLVWIKDRSVARSHVLYDTARGPWESLATNLTAASISQYPDGVTSFNTAGFSLGGGGSVGDNTNGDTYASWTFRKQPKFFDVVGPWTGDGNPKTLSHSLGSVPGCIIVKNITSAQQWNVYHRSLNGGTNPEQYYAVLNSSAASAFGSNQWNSTAPTSTQFTVGSVNNGAGDQFIAYVFAHNAGGFGLTGTDNVISCGSFTTDSSGNFTTTLGYEPQWILFKNSGASSNWNLIDTMRGWPVGAGSSYLRPNTSGAETTDSTPYMIPTATGFAGINNGWGNTQTYIYIAIRRGPMKVPTSGTSVFAIDTRNATTPSFVSNFPVDMSTYRAKSGSDWYLQSRLTPNYLLTNSTDAEAAGYVFSATQFAYNTGWGSSGASIPDLFSYMWQRAPSFFDEVCYTGTGASGAVIPHNLQAAPEMMIVKSRGTAFTNWIVYHSSMGNTYYENLNYDFAKSGPQADVWDSTTPTSSNFYVGNFNNTNGSGRTFVAYLFATCAGVSKVTSFTGNGSSQTINCGFTGGARLVLIKRTDSTGDWYVWDSARGIVSGNDPHLSLNSTAAEVTTDDTIDTDSTGFIVNQVSATNCNVNGASYIVLAVA